MRNQPNEAEARSIDGDGALVHALALRTAALATRDGQHPENVQLDVDDIATAVAFALPGWTLEDYLAAVSDHHNAISDHRRPAD